MCVFTAGSSNASLLCMKHELKCLFTSDLHGNESKYDKLFKYIVVSRPDAVFIGGDLTRPVRYISSKKNDNGFFLSYILTELQKLKKYLKEMYPQIYVILGNDDRKNLEHEVLNIAECGLWNYVHGTHLKWMGYDIYGYSYVPPTPFMLKDWERYDVSRFIPHGSIAPEDGITSSGNNDPDDKYKTIKEDLENIAGTNDHRQSIFLFHSPPYKTLLDRGDPDGKFINHVPIDVNLGSIAIRDFVTNYQPALTMHGHIHESTRLTGRWKDMLGRTWCYNGSHDGPELSIITFNPAEPGSATRKLI